MHLKIRSTVFFLLCEGLRKLQQYKVKHSTISVKSLILHVKIQYDPWPGKSVFGFE